jgi:hypothetical protein
MSPKVTKEWQRLALTAHIMLDDPTITISNYIHLSIFLLPAEKNNYYFLSVVLVG